MRTESLRILKREDEEKFSIIWQRIQAFNGAIFHTKTGKPFSYSASDGHIALNNTDRNIGISDFKKAFCRMPTEYVPTLNDLQGYAYVWGIMMDKRIRQGFW